MSVEVRTQSRVVGRLDLLTSDLIGSADFYHRLFDWEFTGDFAASEATLVRGDPDEGLAVTLTGDGLLAETFGRVGGWELFFDVASVDETVERAWRHGGDVLHAAVDAQDGSRLAVVRDPSGAVFGIIQNLPPGRSAGATVCERGRLVGIELHTTSGESAAGFYRRVFNWETDPDPDPAASLFSRAGRTVAGMVSDPSPVLTKSSWISYFGVTDAAETCRAVEWLGGTVLATTASNVMPVAALVRDPAGAVFGISERRRV